MRSVRLDPELEETLRRAASIEGVTESEFIRAAVRERAERRLGDSLAGRMAPQLGSVRSGLRAGEGRDEAAVKESLWQRHLEERGRRS